MTPAVDLSASPVTVGVDVSAPTHEPVPGRWVVRVWSIVIAVLVSVALPVSAQERRPTESPAQVELALRRRVESWLRERARLACPVCKREDVEPVCEKCAGTGVNPLRLDNAFWRYLRPSFRRDKDAERWLTERVVTGDRGPHWNAHPAYLESATIQSITLSRDFAWVTIAPPGVPAATDTWVREDNAFYLDLDGAPAPDLLKHDWFQEETLSVARAAAELARLFAAEEREGATDIERTRAREERERAEATLRERGLGDLGTIVNVRPSAYVEKPQNGVVDRALDVVVRLGTTEVHVVVRPAGETFEALQQRLGALPRGSRVFFLGTARTWRRKPGAPKLDLLVVDGAEVQPTP